MLKQLGIVAACGIALYGLARYIKNNVVVVIGLSGELPDLLASGMAITTIVEAGTEASHESEDDVTIPQAPADAAVAEVASTDTGQTPPPDGAMRAAS